MESCLRISSICSFEGCFHQLKPISTAAISTNPMMVFLSTIVIVYFLLLIDVVAMSVQNYTKKTEPTLLMLNI